MKRDWAFGDVWQFEDGGKDNLVFVVGKPVPTLHATRCLVLTSGKFRQGSFIYTFSSLPGWKLLETR